jgi:hypothetical protein
VHLFEIETGAFVRSFVNPTSDSNARFGEAITAQEKSIYIGAPGTKFKRGTEEGRSGCAYEFHVDGDLLRTYLPQDLQDDALFGSAIASDATILIVGAPGTSGRTRREGRAHTFIRSEEGDENKNPTPWLLSGRESCLFAYPPCGPR